MAVYRNRGGISGHVFSDMRTNSAEAKVSLEEGVVLCRKVEGSVIPFRCVSDFRGTHNSTLLAVVLKGCLVFFCLQGGGQE